MGLNASRRTFLTQVRLEESLMTLRFGPSALLFVGTLSLLALSGCSMNNLSAPDAAFQGSPIQGTAHGGYQPLTGAHIYLMGASNTGYGAASVSLLTQGDGTDSIGTYVLTISGGGFNITGAYTCVPGQQVYILATGGNPGLTPASYSNSAATLMAAFGTCPSSGSFAGQIPFVTINEVSTVAAAYALAGFAVDPTHIGSSATALSRTGLANAFNNIPSMVNLNYGQAYTTTPAVSGYSSASGLSSNGTVPRAKIYTLADAAAGCVNSTGPASAACTALFANTTNAAGTRPTDVGTAMINLAHNPANTFNFITLATTTAPFQPTLTTAPNDWTMSIQYTSPNSSHPGKPAIDASGNVWIPNVGNTTLTELSPQGVVYSGTTGFTGSGLIQGDAAAVDASGNIWVSNYKNSGVVSEFNSNGTQASVNGFTTPDNFNFDLVVANVNIWFSGQTGTSAVSGTGAVAYTDTQSTKNVGVTTDTIDNIWTTDFNSNLVNVIYTNANGRFTRQFSLTGLNAPAGISSDSANNLWIANSGLNTISKAATGTNFFGAPTVSSTTQYAGAGIFQPYPTAVDGVGNVWIGNSNGTLAGLSNAGTALTPSTGLFTPSNSTYSAVATLYQSFFPASVIYGIAIAGSGDVWATDIDGTISQFIGLAAPTVTPRSFATAGTRP